VLSSRAETNSCKTLLALCLILATAPNLRCFTEAARLWAIADFVDLPPGVIYDLDQHFLVIAFEPLHISIRFLLEVPEVLRHLQLRIDQFAHLHDFLLIDHCIFWQRRLQNFEKP
jgi:hypothetical protein